MAGEKILIVDDDQDIRHQSATQLVLRGPTIAHVVQILITDSDFLMHLPARVTYSNTAYDLACAPAPSGS